MKINYIFSLLLVPFLLSCSDNKYVSNDPNAAPDAPVCYDVNDLHQNYSYFFRPAQGWVGDPMPYYEDGKFHIFYLQDARDGKPTFHPWYKTTTDDFVSYTDDGEMIPCGTIDEQDRALGTGSVYKHDGVYYAFYTGHNGKLDPREKVLLATSSDLKEWTKVKDFELKAGDGYDRNEFRDPIIFRDEASQTFRMLLSTRADYKGSWRAVLAQYSSSDLKNWQLEETFYDDETTFMVECPDVFVEGEYQYLIYSNIADNDRMVHYKYRKVGATTWITPTRSNLDARFYYAAKTASDGTNRYLFGWCPTRDSYTDFSNMSWGGSLVVHQLAQNADGTLRVTVPEIATKVLKNEKALKPSSSKGANINNNTYALDASAEVAYAIFDREESVSKITATLIPQSATRFGFELGACGNRREVFRLTFDLAEKKINLERAERGKSEEVMVSRKLDVTNTTQLDITLLIEKSVATLYVNNEIAFTNRIYKMNQNPWGIFSEDGKVEFSQLTISKK